jgi:hypothetical protein
MKTARYTPFAYLRVNSGGRAYYIKNGKYADIAQIKRIKWLGRMMMLVLVLLWGLAMLKGSGSPAISYVSPIHEVSASVPPKKESPAVLARIAQCESGASHVDKNGQVLINATRDVGYYQINVPIHGKKASEMGLNLFIEEDNKAFAEYLFNNFGSEPWVHSKKCWNR